MLRAIMLFFYVKLIFVNQVSLFVMEILIYLICFPLKLVLLIQYLVFGWLPHILMNICSRNTSM